jgi:hypothetical protein
MHPAPIRRIVAAIAQTIKILSFVRKLATSEVSVFSPLRNGIWRVGFFLKKWNIIMIIIDK